MRFSTPRAKASQAHRWLQWSVASRKCECRRTVGRGYSLIGRLLVLSIIFLSNDPPHAFADGIIWAKKAVAIRGDCYGKRPQKILSPNGEVTVQVLCHAADKNSDPVRYFRITDTAGRTNDAEFEDQYERGDELLWSPDSTEFLVNGSQNSFSGYYVNVYRLESKGLEKLDVNEAAQRDMVVTFPPCKAIYFGQQPDCHAIEKNPEYNMSAIDWVPGRSAIVVMAEVPCASEYGGIMCQVLGYELEVPTGKILSRMTAKELKKRWQPSMNWKMNIPDPPEYARPK